MLEKSCPKVTVLPMERVWTITELQKELSCVIYFVPFSDIKITMRKSLKVQRKIFNKSELGFNSIYFYMTS